MAVVLPSIGALIDHSRARAIATTSKCDLQLFAGPHKLNRLVVTCSNILALPTQHIRTICKAAAPIIESDFSFCDSDRGLIWCAGITASGEVNRHPLAHKSHESSKRQAPRGTLLSRSRVD